MLRNVMVWPRRGSCLVFTCGLFVSTYGCGNSADDCTKLGLCGPANALSSFTKGENCQNGADDDDDGAADCADSDCANLIGCNQLEDGWQYATLRIANHDANAAPVQCPDASVAERLFAGHSGQPTCTACACTNAAPLTCAGGPTLECTRDFQGDQTVWDEIPLNSNQQCQKPANLAATSYCRVPEPALVDASACTPSGGELIDSPPWAIDAFSCAMTPNARTDQAGVCIRREGDQTCPPEWSMKAVLYKSEIGNRACTPCACGGECTNEFTVYDSNNCQTAGPTAPVIVTSAETDVSALTGGQYSLQTHPSKPPSACTPSGGMPAEIVEPADPVTFCCK